MLFYRQNIISYAKQKKLVFNKLNCKPRNYFRIAGIDYMWIVIISLDDRPGSLLKNHDLLTCIFQGTKEGQAGNNNAGIRRRFRSSDHYF